MKSFRSVTSQAVVLDRADVDTDQIIPKQFLKRIERTGYGEFLFYDWRQDPAFELNRAEYAGATILVAGRNFGCGSSREHAAWAIQDYGFEVVVAPSFGDIFASNAVQIGLVTIALPEEQVRGLMGERELTVDLETLTIVGDEGEAITFDFDPFRRHKLLNGLDDIGLTLEHEGDIAAFEAARTGGIATTALPSSPQRGRAKPGHVQGRAG
jgi:3-isopropylmalate/(R)-2-methylmalate dehydratase small subunit